MAITLNPTTVGVNVEIPDFVADGLDGKFKDCIIVTAGASPSLSCKLLNAGSEEIDTLTGATCEEERDGSLVITGTSRLAVYAGVPVQDQGATWFVRPA